MVIFIINNKVYDNMEWDKIPRKSNPYLVCTQIRGNINRLSNLRCINMRTNMVQTMLLQVLSSLSWSMDQNLKRYWDTNNIRNAIFGSKVADAMKAKLHSKECYSAKYLQQFESVLSKKRKKKKCSSISQVSEEQHVRELTLWSGHQNVPQNPCKPTNTSLEPGKMWAIASG